MTKSAYSIIAQDCESSDSIARHARIKAIKPKKVMLVQVNPSVNIETELDEYTFERDSRLSERDIHEGFMKDNNLEEAFEIQGMHECLVGMY